MNDTAKVCLLAASLSILVGGGGMVLSFVYLASGSMADITAGAAGFIASSILIGCGLISATLVATKSAGAAVKGQP